MTGGAGHVRDMQNRARQNRSLRASQKDKFKASSRDLIYSKGKSEKWKFKDISKEKLDEIKKNIRKKARKERKRERIIILIIVLIIIISTLFII